MVIVMVSQCLRAYDLYDFVKFEWLQFSGRLCTTSLWPTQRLKLAGCWPHAKPKRKTKTQTENQAHNCRSLASPVHARWETVISKNGLYLREADRTTAQEPMYKEMVQERLAKLAGGVA